MVVKYTNNNEIKDILAAIMNSTLFFWFWLIYSDCYHLISRELEDFKIDLDKIESSIKQRIINECHSLMADYQSNSEIKFVNYRTTGLVKYQEIDPKKSKHIIDTIDSILSNIFKLTEEELDYIINYDIKYRVGNSD